MEVLLRAVRHANVRRDDRPHYLQRVCDAAIHAGGFSRAWLIWNGCSTEQPPEIASAPDTTPIDLTALSSSSSQPFIYNDCAAEATPEVWRKSARRYGYRAAAVIPLTHRGEACGALVLCAADPGYFHREQEELLADLSELITAALAGLEGGDDPRCRPVSMTVTPVRGDAELERKVRERTLALALAKERAERADQTKSAYLATMSNALRTPLDSVSGLCGLLTEGSAGSLNAQQSAYLKIVRENARYMLALVNDVLDLSRIEAGQLNIVSETFDLDQSIERVMATVRPLADKKGIALSCDLRHSLGNIFSDRRRIEQILLNLLSNAIKYTERGGVSISSDVTAQHALSTRGPAQHVVRLSVADTGSGIDAADMPTIFQPFKQFDAKSPTSREGSGLGLALCRSLADLLGGDIQVRSTRGQGSTFTLSLPLNRVRSPL